MSRIDLPENCFSTLATTGELVILKRGEMGYYQSEWNTNDAAYNKSIADDHNSARGLSPAQVEAMRVGSMFGFATPGADPQRYLDLARLERTYRVQGHIKDPIISLFHPITSDLTGYMIVGKVETYLTPEALPNTILGEDSGITLYAEMVSGKALIPVHVNQSENDRSTIRLAQGCYSSITEINQGYQIIAKVRVGVKEFALAENSTAPSRYATWVRSPANDGDGAPNYYWGHYFNNRDTAVQNFCDRAREQYEREKQAQRPTRKAEGKER